MFFQQPHIRAVNEAQLHERGGHHGFPQDAQAGAFLDTPVKITFVQGLHGHDQLILDGGSQPPACAVPPVTEGFRTSAAAGVDVDGDKGIRKAVIGGVSVLLNDKQSFEHKCIGN